jgi:MoaA/NifB/PqqE/SkfB family radical SAM enzyme
MNGLLANDFVLREDNCNLSCEYCLTGQSNFKTRHSLKLIFEPPQKDTYSPETALGQRMHGVVDGVRQASPLPVIKLTGGEIFLVRGIMDFLRKLSKEYATVVIQTNGVLVNDEAAQEIQSWGNACLQISLDAVSYEGNSYRSSSARQHKLVIDKIFSLLERKIPTEIYTVLNDRSVPWLADTLKQLMPYHRHLQVCPFPVRGPDKEKFYPRQDQIPLVRAILDDFDQYAPVSPPRAYWQRLVRFLEEGGRNFRCHLPRFAFTTFDDGVLTPCPNIWFNTIGNVLKEDGGKVVEQIGKTAFYQLLLADKPRIDACKGCFTPWDTLSMYMDGEITIDELCASPMYSAPQSRAVIERIAREHREGNGSWSPSASSSRLTDGQPDCGSR